MLGSHSTSTGLNGLGSHLRKLIPAAVTIPQYFAKHGYRTEFLAKIFHIGHGNLGDPDSFSVPHFHDKVIDYGTVQRTVKRIYRRRFLRPPPSRPSCLRPEGFFSDCLKI